MPRPSREVIDGRVSVDGTHTRGPLNKVCAAPQNSARSRATMYCCKNVCSLVAATPDVNVSDSQALQASRTTSVHHVTMSNDASAALQQTSASEFSSFACVRSLHNGANTSGPSEDQPLPLLTMVPFSPTSSATKSARSTGAGVESSTGGPDVTTTTGAAATTTSICPGTLSAGRSMTLLERRHNRERSALSLSCLSGLNVETLQESMRETSLVANSQEAPKPVPKGWSKTVASAALLSDYAMPSVRAPLPGVQEARHSREVNSARQNTAEFQGQEPRLPNDSEEGSSTRRRHPTSTSNSRTIDTIPGALKIIGYNILASRLASTDLYPTCPPSVLSEEYRLGLIKKELQRVDPDILLLEEISVAVHERTLGPYLKAVLGMEGHHVVITDRDGTPRCGPPSQQSKTATALSPGATMPCAVPCSTEKRPNSISMTATLTGAAAGKNDAFFHHGAAGSAANNSTDVDRRNSSPHMPPLAETGSSRPTSRRDSGVALSRFPASSCGTLPIRPKPGEASQPQHPQQPSTLSQEMLCSSLEDTQDRLGVMTNEERMQRSHSAVESTQGTTVHVKPQTSSRLRQPTVSTETIGAGTPSAVLRVEKAAEDFLGHRRVEMDGVSIFYKSARFRELEVVPVLFNRLAAGEKRLTFYEHKKLRVDSHNVALVVVLQDTQVIGVSRIYVVAAVHLIWQRVNAQLWQAHQLLRVMEALKQKYSKGYVDFVYPSGRGSIAYDSATTQPPSIIDTPLVRDGVRRFVQDDVAPQPSLSTPLLLQQPRALSAQCQSIVPSCTTTEASDLAGESDGSRFLNITATDRMRGRYASMCSATASSHTSSVTCIIGGDFNSERSGPVMEYLCTGRVPGGAEVMEYWRAPKSESPVPLDRTDERGTGRATGRDAMNALHPTPPPSSKVPPPTVCGVLSAARQDAINGSPYTSTHPSLSAMNLPPSVLHRCATKAPAHDFVGYTSSAEAMMTGTGEGLCLYRPYTPLSKRPFDLYPSRLLDSVVAPQSRAGNSSQCPQGSVKGTAAAASTAPRRSSPAPNPKPAGNNLRLDHRSTSATHLSTSSSLIGTPSFGCDDGCGGGRNLATVTVSPSAYVVYAPLSSPAPPCSSDVQPTRLQSSVLMNSVSTADLASPASAPPTSPSSDLQNRDSAPIPGHQRVYTRRHSLPGINDMANNTLEPSCSRSTSEVGSVLSTAFSTSCAMRLALHTCHDALGVDLGEPHWEDEGSRGRTPRLDDAAGSASSAQPNPLHNHEEERSCTGGTVENVDVSAKRRHLIHPLASSTDAGGLDNGSNASGSLKCTSVIDDYRLSLYGDLETPASPRGRPKRRPPVAVSEDAAPSLVSPQATNHLSSKASPHSPSVIEHNTTPSTVSTSTPTSLLCLPALIANNTYTPSSPPVPLIDDVVHAMRLSDAYAPYCYRHPSYVSAVNPSTNMEGKVLDHILYEDEHVVCGGVWRLGERQELPNARVPSDHYMIGSVLIPIQELHRE